MDGPHQFVAIGFAVPDDGAANVALVMRTAARAGRRLAPLATGSQRRVDRLGVDRKRRGFDVDLSRPPLPVRPPPPRFRGNTAFQSTPTGWGARARPSRDLFFRD